MKPIAIVLLAVALRADSAIADMSFPLHTSVPTRTTVKLEQPIPGYFFYAASLFSDGYIVRLRFEEATSVPVPHLHDRMVLFAVPVATAERFPTLEALGKELREQRPKNIHTFSYDGFFIEFTLDTYRDDQLHIVIRQGKDGIEFERTHEPRATGSRRVLMLFGLLFTAALVWWGWRWVRGRYRTANPPVPA